MKSNYEGVDARTVEALMLDSAEIVDRLGPKLTVHDDNDALIRSMAKRFIADYQTTIAEDRDCVMIVPVGPVGQYDLIAQSCVEQDLSLSRLVLIIMDEYLSYENRWIDPDDPLSFRGHIQRHLVDRLPVALRPRAVHVPDPLDLGRIPEVLADHGGLDFCYAGVGITGHLAFNDPEPGRDYPDWVAELPTRVVRLLPETRLINSVTAAGGNTLRIPYLAATVGMKEILSARALRIWMNRDWQRAAIRRMLFGPVTGAYPASLVQTHPNWSVDAVSPVLDDAEPGLR